MKIEITTTDDVPALAHLIRRYFPYTNADVLNVTSRMRTNRFSLFKVTHQNEVIGFLELEQLDFLFGILRLNGMAIKEEYRGKGFGQKILEFAIDFAKKTKQTQLRLLVHPQNTIAQKLYEKNGFTHLGLYAELVQNEKVNEMVLKLV